MSSPDREKQLKAALAAKLKTGGIDVHQAAKQVLMTNKATRAANAGFGNKNPRSPASVASSPQGPAGGLVVNKSGRTSSQDAGGLVSSSTTADHENVFVRTYKNALDSALHTGELNADNILGTTEASGSSSSHVFHNNPHLIPVVLANVCKLAELLIGDEGGAKIPDTAEKWQAFLQRSIGEKFLQMEEKTLQLEEKLLDCEEKLADSAAVVKKHEEERKELEALRKAHAEVLQQRDDAVAREKNAIVEQEAQQVAELRRLQEQNLRLFKALDQTHQVLHTWAAGTWDASATKKGNKAGAEEHQGSTSPMLFLPAETSDVVGSSSSIGFQSNKDARAVARRASTQAFLTPRGEQNEGGDVGASSAQSMPNAGGPLSPGELADGAIGEALEALADDAEVTGNVKKTLNDFELARSIFSSATMSRQRANTGLQPLSPPTSAGNKQQIKSPSSPLGKPLSPQTFPVVAAKLLAKQQEDDITSSTRQLFELLHQVDLKLKEERMEKLEAQHRIEHTEELEQALDQLQRIFAEIQADQGKVLDRIHKLSDESTAVQAENTRLVAEHQDLRRVRVELGLAEDTIKGLKQNREKLQEEIARLIADTETLGQNYANRVTGLEKELKKAGIISTTGAGAAVSSSATASTTQGKNYPTGAGNIKAATSSRRTQGAASSVSSFGSTGNSMVMATRDSSRKQISTVSSTSFGSTGTSFFRGGRNPAAEGSVKVEAGDDVVPGIEEEEEVDLQLKLQEKDLEIAKLLSAAKIHQRSTADLKKTVKQLQVQLEEEKTKDDEVAKLRRKVRLLEKTKFDVEQKFGELERVNDQLKRKHEVSSDEVKDLQRRVDDHAGKEGGWRKQLETELLREKKKMVAEMAEAKKALRAEMERTLLKHHDQILHNFAEQEIEALQSAFADAVHNSAHVKEKVRKLHHLGGRVHFFEKRLTVPTAVAGGKNKSSRVGAPAGESNDSSYESDEPLDPVSDVQLKRHARAKALVVLNRNIDDALATCELEKAHLEKEKESDHARKSGYIEALEHRVKSAEKEVDQLHKDQDEHREQLESTITRLRSQLHQTTVTHKEVGEQQSQRNEHLELELGKKAKKVLQLQAEVANLREEKAALMLDKHHLSLTVAQSDAAAAANAVAVVPSGHQHLADKVKRTSVNKAETISSTSSVHQARLSMQGDRLKELHRRVYKDLSLDMLSSGHHQFGLRRTTLLRCALRGFLANVVDKGVLPTVARQEPQPASSSFSSQMMKKDQRDLSGHAEIGFSDNSEDRVNGQEGDNFGVVDEGVLVHGMHTVKTVVHDEDRPLHNITLENPSEDPNSSTSGDHDAFLKPSQELVRSSMARTSAASSFEIEQQRATQFVTKLNVSGLGIAQQESMVERLMNQARQEGAAESDIVRERIKLLALLQEERKADGRAGFSVLENVENDENKERRTTHAVHFPTFSKLYYPELEEELEQPTTFEFVRRTSHHDEEHEQIAVSDGENVLAEYEALVRNRTAGGNPRFQKFSQRIGFSFPPAAPLGGAGSTAITSSATHLRAGERQRVAEVDTEHHLKLVEVVESQEEALQDHAAEDVDDQVIQTIESPLFLWYPENGVSVESSDSVSQENSSGSRNNIKRLVAVPPAAAVQPAKGDESVGPMLGCDTSRYNVLYHPETPKTPWL
ncbi:unnamed protein product [Amoebophrya sp. A120]|nr:unnamed protein product [Amoebophrya sp. A120]|eukprot:GSA120T00018306001.1